jgi:hypothetical protein
VHEQSGFECLLSVTVACEEFESYPCDGKSRHEFTFLHCLTSEKLAFSTERNGVLSRRTRRYDLPVLEIYTPIVQERKLFTNQLRQSRALASWPCVLDRRHLTLHFPQASAVPEVIACILDFGHQILPLAVRSRFIKRLRSQSFHFHPRVIRGRAALARFSCQKDN